MFKTNITKSIDKFNKVFYNKIIQNKHNKKLLEFQKKTDNLYKGAAIPPLYGEGHMSKKIEYSQDKIIENNSFGNGAQIADVIVNNSVKQEEQQDKDLYKPKPIWRSPFTLAVLTWMSCIIGILSLLALIV